MGRRREHVATRRRPSCSSRSTACSCPGGFGSRGWEGKILACQVARERGIPYLGICLGMHVAVSEFAPQRRRARGRELDRDGSRDAVPGDRPAPGAEGDRGSRRHDAARRAGGRARRGHADARGLRRGGHPRAPPAPLRGQQPVPRRGSSRPGSSSRARSRRGGSSRSSSCPTTRGSSRASSIRSSSRGRRGRRRSSASSSAPRSSAASRTGVRAARAPASRLERASRPRRRTASRRPCASWARKLDLDLAPVLPPQDRPAAPAGARDRRSSSCSSSSELAAPARDAQREAAPRACSRGASHAYCVDGDVTAVVADDEDRDRTVVERLAEQSSAWISGSATPITRRKVASFVPKSPSPSCCRCSSSSPRSRARRGGARGRRPGHRGAARARARRRRGRRGPAIGSTIGNLLCRLPGRVDGRDADLLLRAPRHRAAAGADRAGRRGRRRPQRRRHDPRRGQQVGRRGDDRGRAPDRRGRTPARGRRAPVHAEGGGRPARRGRVRPSRGSRPSSASSTTRLRRSAR